MSTVDYNLELEGMHAPGPVVSSVRDPKPLHRIKEVRQQQGVSLRSVARKLGLPMQDVRQQEHPQQDLLLTQLSSWQSALDVPLVDLLVDNESPLSAPVSQRAGMLRIMKTAKALEESALDGAASRLVAMLISQLVEVMPELKEVSAWHSVGQRRTQDEMGRIVERTIPDSLFGDHPF